MLAVFVQSGIPERLALGDWSDPVVYELGKMKYDQRRKNECRLIIPGK